MVKKKKKVSKIQEFWKFIRINIWVEKFRIKALGGWFWVDTFKNIWDRIIPFFNTFIYGTILNKIIALATSTNKDLRELYIFLGISIGVTILQRLINSYYYNYNYVRGTLLFRYYIEQAVYRKLEELNWDHIENSKTERNINQVFNRGMDNINTMANTHLDLVGVVGSFIFAFSLVKISWVFFPIMFLQQLPSIIYAFKTNRMSLKLNDETIPDWIRSSQLSGVFRDFKMLYEIKVSGVTKYFRELLNDVYFSVTGKYLDLNRKTLPFSYFIDIYETVIRYGIYGFFLNKVLFQGMLLGTFQYTTDSINKVSDNIYSFLNGLTRLTGAYPYVVFVYDFLSMKNDKEDGKLEFTGEKVVFRFEHVSFKYKGSKHYSIKDISLTIDDNDRVALVGENGAGKSTFLKLLMLVHYPTEGTIYLNDIPLEQYSKASLYNAIAVITQDFSRYSALQVKQNISVYGREPNPELNQVTKAAKLAEADDFISKLPNKYDTYLTKRLDGGTELSTGQWQRIAIARQFYADRPLIVLDEPTASIDPIAEAKIFENLYEHVKNKTVIVVSHRYNTVRAAKKIFVFNKGEIIERGSHAELVKLNGYYAKAFDIQQEEKKL